ncbi:Protein of unknown function [Pyronema omphalodes CBS 100304]|uniref:Uncharacterized protein n=1 Tax=Pyronema omphalodes (strain CBS 100304) TaxID=1076935 RepID=U4LC03_PYROM|nr:Protein of unknown function [Pyronema omphalodes CBS 100304]
MQQPPVVNPALKSRAAVATLQNTVRKTTMFFPMIIPQD